jgi:hypothetical protein
MASLQSISIFHLNREKNVTLPLKNQDKIFTFRNELKNEIYGV